MPSSTSKSVLSIAFVLGLLIASSSASPIPRFERRDEAQAACPGTLRGPSGNAYFAFSSNLNNQVAQQACSSCYGGVLANVGATDLQFLAGNLESTSWIKSWNGDDYSNSCLTLQPIAGAEPGVGVDAACAAEIWPLCQASADSQAGGVQRSEVEGQVETLITLAIPYTASEPVVSIDQVATLEENTVEAIPPPQAEIDETPTSYEVVPDDTPELKAEEPISSEEAAPEVAQAPQEVQAPQEAEATQEAEAPQEVQASQDAKVPQEIEAFRPSEAPQEAEVPQAAEAPQVAEVPQETQAPQETQETQASEVVEAAPVPAAQKAAIEDPLAIKKEKIRAAFEEDADACSAWLALGETDPLQNEYAIESLSKMANCSQERQETLAAEALSASARAQHQEEQ